MTTDTEVRRLYKSRTDRMLDGICGGIAEYFGIDSTLIRIAWVLLSLLGGTGILLYLIAMIIMPTNPSAVTTSPASATPEGHTRSTKFWGILLVVVGTVWFLDNLGVPFWHHWWGFSWDYVFPVLLILAGAAFMFGGRNSMTTAPAPEVRGTKKAVPPPPRPARLYKARYERKLFGVCGGIAAYFDSDPTLVRLVFIAAAFASFGFMLLLYIIMAIVVPTEPKPVQA
jgi:phage shock protein C